MPPSSKHSPTSSYISNFHMPLGVGVPFSELFYRMSTYTQTTSFAGQVPGFIVHGTSLHRSSPITTDDASYSDTFQLSINIDAADFP